MTSRLLLLAAAALAAVPAVVAAAEEEPPEFKFAYVVMEKVLDEYVLFADADKQAKEKIKEIQTQDRDKLGEYQAKIDELETKLSGPLTPEAKTQVEAEYKTSVQEALDFRESLITKYKRLERDAFEPVWEKVYEKVASYAERENYEVVFDYSATLVYADEKYDITEEIIQELNDEAGAGQ